MAIPSTWTTIDPTAWAADEPLPSALLQMGAINGRYLNINHTRAATIAYDRTQRPVMCGAIPPGDTESAWERVAIPYLWDPQGATTVTVTASVELVIPSGTGTFTVNAHWQEISDFTDRPIRRAAVPTINSGANVVLSTAGNSFETFELDLTNRVNVGRSGPILIWLVGTSSETSTAVVFGNLDSLNQVLTRSAETTTGSGNITNDAAPERVLYLFSTNAVGKQDIYLPKRRQIIRQEVAVADGSGDDILYIWPPYIDPNSTTASLGIAKTAATPLPAFAELTSLHIYGVSILDTTPELPEYGDQLNAAQGPGSRAAQYLYSLSAGPWLERTPVHAVGSVADVSALDVYDGTSPISKVYPSALIASSGVDYPLASAYLQHRDVFQAPSASSDLTRVGVRVRALVVLEIGPSYITPAQPDLGSVVVDFFENTDSLDVSFSLLAESELGAAQVTGDAQTYTLTPIAYNSQIRASPGASLNRCAAMLDLKRAIANATTGDRGTDKENHAHTLFGALPESSWADCASTLIDVYVTDTVVSQRVITLQATINGTVVPESRVHLLSWIVTHTENTDESAVVGA